MFLCCSLYECVCDDLVCVCVCVCVPVCAGVQEWVRQSKLFIQVQWPAAHYRDE